MNRLISEKLKGNRHRLGYKASDETKEKQRKAITRSRAIRSYLAEFGLTKKQFEAMMKDRAVK